MGVVMASSLLNEYLRALSVSRRLINQGALGWGLGLAVPEPDAPHMHLQLERAFGAIAHGNALPLAGQQLLGVGIDAQRLEVGAPFRGRRTACRGALRYPQLGLKGVNRLIAVDIEQEA
ncbi:hypothetical protein [Halochromatium glycolicum]|uniref:Uncharacterized protein n=1 Tax=Halochromatium glycolicum TaxID=85075 RepID=A0AAJ0UAG8_9GAMM|nr:hypothetical protein [Halochromatium glycolicum]MBK1707410.1 hypothetical protein [Halochromatium glycolicum]